MVDVSRRKPGMTRWIPLILITTFMVLTPMTAMAEVIGWVTLKDGSRIYGDVMSMTEGILTIKTTFGADALLKVKWEEVTQVVIDTPLPFLLKEGTTLKGTAVEGPSGAVHILAEPLSHPVSVPLSSVAAIHPPRIKPVTYTGNFTFGYSTTRGNTDTENLSMLGELVARSTTLRLTLLGRYSVAENNGSLTARNGRGTMKLDFFLTKRFYIFTSAYFENDTFQDLKLRTALSTGPGYQFFEKGEFRNSYVKELQFYGEVGLSFFNEDFNQKTDQSSIRSRISFKWDWPLIKHTVMVFHYSEIFPSVEDIKNYYVTLDQGIRLTITKGWLTKFQITWRYDNQPPPGVKNSDTLFLLTLGYHFDTRGS